MGIGVPSIYHGGERGSDIRAGRPERFIRNNREGTLIPRKAEAARRPCGPRARAMLVLLAALALASLSSSVRASRFIPMESQSDTSGLLGYVIETNSGAAQSFVPTANFTATRVAAFVQDTGKSDA